MLLDPCSHLETCSTSSTSEAWRVKVDVRLPSFAVLLVLWHSASWTKPCTLLTLRFAMPHFKTLPRSVLRCPNMLLCMSSPPCIILEKTWTPLACGGEVGLILQQLNSPPCDHWNPPFQPISIDDMGSLQHLFVFEQNSLNFFFSRVGAFLTQQNLIPIADHPMCIPAYSECISWPTESHMYCWPCQILGSGYAHGQGSTN